MNAIRGVWWVWKAILWRRARRLLSCARAAVADAPVCTGDVDGKPAADGIRSGDAGTERAGGGFRPSVHVDGSKSEELLTRYRGNDVLWRLYHEEVTLYDPQDVEFKCTCSRTLRGRAGMPDEEADVRRKKGEIDMHCDCCGNVTCSMRGYRGDHVTTHFLPSTGSLIAPFRSTTSFA